ncbi:MAG: hypothetical protein ACI4RF_08805 [Eubacterium sp.]
MFNSIFGGLFDFNNDGKLDAFERGAEFALLNELMKQTENDDDDYDDYDNCDFDD